MDTLNCSKILAVKVFVVLRRLTDLQKYVCLDAQQINEIVRNFLRKTPLVSGEIVSDRKKLSGTLCGIYSVHICEVWPELNNSMGVISTTTDIEVLDIQIKEEVANSKFESALLKSREFQSLLQSLRHTVDHLRSWLLWGLPGCDKNFIITYITSKCNAWLLEIKFHLYQPNCNPIQKLEEIIVKAMAVAKHKLCMIYIEEFDKFYHYAGTQLLVRLASLKDWKDLGVGNLVLCATTDRLTDLDANWSRTLFKRQILLEAPKRAERSRVLGSLLAGNTCTDELNVEALADSTAGETEADLNNLVALALQDRKSEVLRVDFTRALAFERFMQKKAGLFISTKPVNWTDIGGHDSIKVQLLQATVWPLVHPEAFVHLGEFPPKGILLTGPPGCGKTTLVKALASMSNISFLSASASQLYSPYVGESEKKMTALMQQAKACAPSIVFIDELDSVVGSRSMSGCKGDGGSSGVHERVLSTLLNSLDGVGSRVMDLNRVAKQIEVEAEGRTRMYNEDFEDNVLLVAASNRPDMIDKALLRPGRIDRIIHVPPPDLTGRVNILQVYTRNKSVGSLNLEEIARRTGSFTGADLENLCKQAFLMASLEQLYQHENVEDRHFIQVLKTMKPTCY